MGTRRGMRRMRWRRRERRSIGGARHETTPWQVEGDGRDMVRRRSKRQCASVLPHSPPRQPRSSVSIISPRAPLPVSSFSSMPPTVCCYVSLLICPPSSFSSYSSLRLAPPSWTSRGVRQGSDVHGTIS
eukprot:7610656-Pyramimonas_sp.AAC.1